MSEDRLPTDEIPREEPLRHPWIWAVYLILFGLSIPWYLPAGHSSGLWLGLPSWTVVSILATACIAPFTALVIHRYWADESQSSDSPTGSKASSPGEGR